MARRPNNDGLKALVADLAAMERFWLRVEKLSDDACWEYSGYLSHGYGRFHYRGRAFFSHRISFLISNGDIPDHLVIDHICRNRACCNPAHLRAVTLRTNVLENSESVTAYNAQATHCKRGHPLSGINLKPTRTGGQRVCATCDRERNAEWVKRNAHWVTEGDRSESRRLLEERDVETIARAVAALRFLTHRESVNANSHLKGQDQ